MKRLTRRLLIMIAALWTAAALALLPVMAYGMTTAFLVAVEPDLPHAVVRVTGISIAALAVVCYTGGAIYYAVNVFGQRR